MRRSGIERAEREEIACSDSHAKTYVCCRSLALVWFLYCMYEQLPALSLALAAALITASLFKRIIRNTVPRSRSVMH